MLIVYITVMQSLNHQMKNVVLTLTFISASSHTRFLWQLNTTMLTSLYLNTALNEFNAHLKSMISQLMWSCYMIDHLAVTLKSLTKIMTHFPLSQHGSAESLWCLRSILYLGWVTSEVILSSFRWSDIYETVKAL